MFTVSICHCLKIWYLHSICHCLKNWYFHSEYISKFRELICSHCYENWYVHSEYMPLSWELIFHSEYISMFWEWYFHTEYIPMFRELIFSQWVYSHVWRIYIFTVSICHCWFMIIISRFMKTNVKRIHDGYILWSNFVSIHC